MTFVDALFVIVFVVQAPWGEGNGAVVTTPHPTACMDSFRLQERPTCVGYTTAVCTRSTSPVSNAARLSNGAGRATTARTGNLTVGRSLALNVANR